MAKTQPSPLGSLASQVTVSIPVKTLPASDGKAHTIAGAH
jgi:hypothetical protein